MLEVQIKCSLNNNNLNAQIFLKLKTFIESLPQFSSLYELLLGCCTAVRMLVYKLIFMCTYIRSIASLVVQVWELKFSYNSPSKVFVHVYVVLLFRTKLEQLLSTEIHRKGGEIFNSSSRNVYYNIKTWSKSWRNHTF